MIFGVFGVGIIQNFGVLRCIVVLVGDTRGILCFWVFCGYFGCILGALRVFGYILSVFWVFLGISLVFGLV